MRKQRAQNELNENGLGGWLQQPHELVSGLHVFSELALGWCRYELRGASAGHAAERNVVVGAVQSTE